jgi:predicted HicB family RNase H-like nuclease
MRHDKHEKSACSEQIVLRLPRTLRDQIEVAAACEGRSLANMTRRILEHWVSERDQSQAAA